MAFVPAHAPFRRSVSICDKIDFQLFAALLLIVDDIAVLIFHAYISSPYSSMSAQASE